MYVDETHQSAFCSESFRRWHERHWYIVFLHTWWPFPCMCVWRGQFWVFLMQIKSPSNRCPMGQKLLLRPKSLYISCPQWGIFMEHNLSWFWAGRSMYGCFPLLILRWETFPSQGRYHLTAICPRDTYGSHLGLTWLSPKNIIYYCPGCSKSVAIVGSVKNLLSCSGTHSKGLTKGR